jgi:hypothetical protein
MTDSSSCLTTLQKPFQPLTSIPLYSQTHVSGQETPVYISPEGDPLSKFYEQIELPVEAVPPCGNFIFSIITHDHISLVFRPQESLDLRMPPPHGFDSLDEYAAVLRDWYARALRYFGMALLPSTLTGVFHLPEPPKIFTKEEKADAGRFRTFKANLWPLLPQNYLDMLDRVFKQAQVEADEPFANQIPKREVIYYRHHLSPQPQWLAQLLPAEPRAELYDSYEDFARAYRNWAGLAQASLHTPIIPVREFATIAAIDIFRPTKAVPKRIVPADGRVLKVSEICPHPRRYPMSSVAQFEAPAKFPDSVGLGGPPCPPPDLAPLEVFGVNATEFMTEHRRFGYSLASLQHGEALPRAVLHSSGGTAVVSEVTSMLMAAISYDFSLVRKMIDADLGPRQFDEVMRFEINGARSCGFISQVLNSAGAIRQLTSLSRISEAYRFRVSFLLAAIFRNDSTTPLPKMLLNPANLDALHRTVTAVNLTSLYRVPLLPVLTTPNRLYQTINRFYLLTTLMAVMRDCQNGQWYQDALDPCRDMAREIGDALLTRADQLRPAEPGKDAYSAMLMVFASGGFQPTRILLGYNFLNWMGVRLLMRVEHSRTVIIAARAFLVGVSERVYEPLLDWVAKLSPHVISFIESACGALRRQALECGIRVPSLAMASLFDAILSTDSGEVDQLILPIAHLMCDKRVMVNFFDKAYQQRLRASVCWLCQQMPRAAAAHYKVRMEALTLFAHDEAMCYEMTLASGFSAFVVSHLSQTESRLIPVNWGFFVIYAGHPRVIQEILNGQAGTILATIVSTECIPILRRFFQFSINLWRTQLPAIVAKFCDLMMGSLGRLTAVFRTRKAMFKEDPGMVTLVEDYAGTIAHLQAPGAERFIEAFKKYMETDLSEFGKKGGFRSRHTNTWAFSQAVERSPF